MDRLRDELEPLLDMIASWDGHMEIGSAAATLYAFWRRIGEGQQPPVDRDAIRLGQRATSKEEAITMAGQVLIDEGAADDVYVKGMLAREKQISTYMGEGVAIPHGVDEVRDHIDNLPEGEREPWRTLWKDVNALLEEALKQVKDDLSLTQLSTVRLCVSSGASRLIVPCANPDILRKGS